MAKFLLIALVNRPLSLLFSSTPQRSSVSRENYATFSPFSGGSQEPFAGAKGVAGDGRGQLMKKSCYLAVLLAWVLWTRTQGPTADSWIGAPGFLNQEKCLASMKEKLDLWRQFKD